MRQPTLAQIQRLWQIIGTLRGEGGCPWDRKQRPDTVKAYLIEEAHEAEAAVRAGNLDEIREELGDLLFMTFFMIHLFEEQQAFTLEDVCAEVCEKMVGRHPHVFGNIHLTSAEEVKENWERIKREEKRGRSHTTSIPNTLPSLMRAHRLLAREALAPPAPHEEGALCEHIRRLVEAVSHEGDDERNLADLFVLLCQLARLRGYRAEDLLHKRLDEREAHPSPEAPRGTL